MLGHPWGTKSSVFVIKYYMSIYREYIEKISILSYGLNPNWDFPVLAGGPILTTEINDFHNALR